MVKLWVVIFSICILSAIVLPIISSKAYIPNSQQNLSYPLFTASDKIYMNDSMNKVRESLTKNALPNILEDRHFSGNVEADYTQNIKIGKHPRLVFQQQPTSDNDPSAGFSLSTITSNAIYNYTITFSKVVSFNDSKSLGKKIRLLGKDFTISDETSGYQIILVDKKSNTYKLLSGSEIFINDQVVDGTQVTFSGGDSNPGSLITIRIQFAAPDSDSDAILEGNKFVDGVFGTFALYFESLSTPVFSPNRENITVDAVADGLLRFKFRNYEGLEKALVFLNNESQPGMILADASGKRIVVREMETVNKSEYLILGNEDEGHLLRVESIVNSSNGYLNDLVKLKDIFSNITYTSIPTAEGTATIDIGDNTYVLTYVGSTSIGSEAKFIRVNDPDTNGANIALFRTIQTSKGAKVALYQPTSINVTDWDGISKGVNLTTLSLPDGDGYTTATFSGIGNNNDIEGVNVTCGGTTKYFNTTTTTALSCSIGQLTYNFTYQSANLVQLFLVAKAGGNVNTPSVIVFEGKDNDKDVYNALIVKTEGSGTPEAKTGVSSVDLTWGHDFKEKKSASDIKIFKSMDGWGSMITTDKSDSDQYKATISYPEEQVYAKIYAVGSPENLIVDAAVMNISISPSTPKLGDLVSTNITIKNVGDVKTYVQYKIGIETPYEGFGGENCPSCLLLDPDQVYVEQFFFKASANGLYMINASVNAVDDNNLINNKKSYLFTV